MTPQEKPPSLLCSYFLQNKHVKSIFLLVLVFLFFMDLYDTFLALIFVTLDFPTVNENEIIV